MSPARDTKASFFPPLITPPFFSCLQEVAGMRAAQVLFVWDFTSNWFIMARLCGPGAVKQAERPILTHLNHLHNIAWEAAKRGKAQWKRVKQGWLSRKVRVRSIIDLLLLSFLLYQTSALLYYPLVAARSCLYGFVSSAVILDVISPRRNNRLCFFRISCQKRAVNS